MARRLWPAGLQDLLDPVEPRSEALGRSQLRPVLPRDIAHRRHHVLDGPLRMTNRFGVESEPPHRTARRLDAEDRVPLARSGSKSRYDPFVDAADLRRAARSLPAARYQELAGAHFLPLYYPDLMLEELSHLTAARPSSE